MSVESPKRSVRTCQARSTSSPISSWSVIAPSSSASSKLIRGGIANPPASSGYAGEARSGARTLPAGGQPPSAAVAGRARAPRAPRRGRPAGTSSALARRSACSAASSSSSRSSRGRPRRSTSLPFAPPASSAVGERLVRLARTGPRRRRRSRSACPRAASRAGRRVEITSWRSKSSASSKAPGGGLRRALPDRGGVAADRAEAAALPPAVGRAPGGDVEGAEAAHRDAADRDPLGLDVEAADERRDQLLGARTSPRRRRRGRASRSPAPPRGKATTGARPPWRPSASNIGLAQVAVLVLAAAVQEDEQRAAPVAGAGRDHDADRHSLAEQLAVDRRSRSPWSPRSPRGWPARRARAP